MSEGLDVVIVSYRCKDLLRNCLQSLADHPPGRSMRAHVVDNASRDGTVEMVAREFPEVALTPLATNRGFGAANNLAFVSSSAEYVLVLNPDTRVEPGALDHLLATMDSKPKVGICGPCLVRPDGTLDHAARRSFPTPVSAIGHFTGLGTRARAPAAFGAYRGDLGVAGPADAVNGACMLIRREALEEVGGFDEGYWMYMEDLDLCYRFAKAGWVTWYEPGARVVHVKGGTARWSEDPRLAYHFHYGMFRFFQAHYAPDRNPIRNAAVYAGIGAKTLASVARAALRRKRPRARAWPRR